MNILLNTLGDPIWQVLTLVITLAAAVLIVAVRTHDVHASKQQKRRYTLTGNQRRCRQPLLPGVAFPGGVRAFSCSSRPALQLQILPLSRPQQADRRRTRRSPSTVFAVVWSPDGTRIASGR
jgi:hypothetical protein